MSRTPEGKVKDQCVAVLHSFGAYYFFPVTGGYGKSGVPDIIVCYNGCFIGVECKVGYNKPTALQEREMRRIETAGGRAMVVREDTVNLLVEALERIRNGTTV